MVQPWDYLHKAGRSGLTFDSFAEQTGGTGAAGSSAVGNIMRAQPLWVGDEPLRLLKIGFRARNTPAGVTVKMAIYSPTSLSNIYPAGLVHDFGTAPYILGQNWTPDTDVTLQPGMYWATVLHNDPGYTGNWWSVSASISVAWVTTNVMGLAPGFNGVVHGFQVARAFAAGFPATFPAGATAEDNTSGQMPAILMEPFG